MSNCRPFGIEGGKAASNFIGVDELMDIEASGHDSGSGAAFSRAVGAADDDDIRRTGPALSPQKSNGLNNIDNGAASPRKRLKIYLVLHLNKSYLTIYLQ